jgi:hypothetical protein
VLPANIQIGTMDDHFGSWSEPKPFSSAGVPNLLFDARRGRVNMPDMPFGHRLFVTYGYAAPADIGGGPYDRDDDLAALLPPTVTRHYAVSRSEAHVSPPAVYGTFQDAVLHWNAAALPGDVGLITILDSGAYDLPPMTTIKIPQGATLVVAAATWPTRTSTSSYSASGVWPWLRGGTIEVRGAGGTSAFVLHGVALAGAIQITAAPGPAPAGGLGSCTFSHCTLRAQLPGPPPPAAVQAMPGSPSLTITADRSIIDTVIMDVTCEGFSAEDCLFGANAAQQSVLAQGADATIKACTFKGVVQLRTIEAENSIFMGPVNVLRRQEGCVRYSFVGLDEHVPRRYRCQPDLAVVGLTDDDEIAAAVESVTPTFRAVWYLRADSAGTNYVDPDYLRLSDRCADEIRNGADDGGEMGGFHMLGTPQLVRNLEQAAEDFLRAGCATANRFIT